MKILILPDLHMKLPLLKKVSSLLDKHPSWHCVSLGDWVDDWGAFPNDYAPFLKELVAFCERYQKRLTLCWGNHDYGYWAYPGKHSGFQYDARDGVRNSLWQLQKTTPIQTVYSPPGSQVIFSHAGITEDIFHAYATNLRSYPHISLFDFCNQLTPKEYWEDNSPLWARPTMEATLDSFNPSILQVVGHTPVTTITHVSRSHILYTDTWSTDSYFNPIGDCSLALIDTSTNKWTVLH